MDVRDEVVRVVRSWVGGAVIEMRVPVLAVLLALYIAERRHELGLGRRAVLGLANGSLRARVGRKARCAVLTNGRGTATGPRACRWGLGDITASSTSIMASALADDVRLHRDRSRRSVQFVAVRNTSVRMLS